MDNIDVNVTAENIDDIDEKDMEFTGKDRTPSIKRRRNDYRKAARRRDILNLNLPNIPSLDHSKGLHQLVKASLSGAKGDSTKEKLNCTKTQSHRWGYNPKMQDKKRDMAMESQLNDFKTENKGDEE